MATATFIHDGNAIDYTPTVDVLPGTVIQNGLWVGVAKQAILASKPGTLALTGVFDFPKAAGDGVEFAVGGDAFWNDELGEAHPIRLSPIDAYLGQVLAAAADADTTVRVRRQGASVDIDINPVQMAVESGTVIAVGDLLFLDTDNAKPASAQDDQGSAAANQQLFHDVFFGIAMDASPAGVVNTIRVATTGTCEFDCASASYEVGDLIGPTENGAGNALLNQSVIAVGNPNAAIGRCARTAASSTKVLVEIVSTAMYGGPQAAA